MNIAEIESLIRTAVESQRARGVEIVANISNLDWRHGEAVFGDLGSCTCVLGCLVIDRQKDLQDLGIPNDVSAGIICGFDGRTNHSDQFRHPEEVYALGVKLRLEYIEGKEVAS